MLTIITPSASDALVTVDRVKNELSLTGGDVDARIAVESVDPDHENLSPISPATRVPSLMKPRRPHPRISHPH